MQKYAIRKDDYLRPENKRLRDTIERMQSDGYIGELNSDHEKETTKLNAKIQRQEKECGRYEEKLSQYKDDRRKIVDLKWGIIMLEAGEEESRKRISHLEDALLETQNRLSTALAENCHLRESVSALTKANTELEDQNKKLTSQINRDYTNSSIPSSRCVNHGIIHNGREKTGRKPGGQLGHEGHLRKKFEPTATKVLPPPFGCAACNSGKMHPTGKTKTRQLVDIEMLVSATDFISCEFECEECGKTFYAGFPEGIMNEMNYGTGIKTLACMLGNYCNVSIDKTLEMISELTDGKVQLSKGTISNLLGEFSEKASAALTETGNDIRKSPVMNTDATGSRLNGKTCHVFIYANDNGKIYSAQAHKGIAALKGSLADSYGGTLIHDHDTSFYHFGGSHQECNVHMLRYLLDAKENEPKLTWHGEMRELLLEMNSARKDWILREEKQLPADIITDFESRYDAILDKADAEYTEHPPNKYFTEGISLARRMRKYKGNHLLFLHDFKVPWDNNLSERSLRKVKGKLKEAGTFRSMDNGMQPYCDFLSIAETAKSKKLSVYRTVRNVFDASKKIWDTATL